MRDSFFERVAERQERLNTPLCVGLDPRPAWFTPEDHATGNPWLAWGRRLLDAVAEYACCVKPNIAFYEAGGLEALDALRQTIAHAHALGLPVLLDAKRGDIGSTADAYARACYEWLDADAVTLSPYLGEDAVRPFLQDPRRAVFVLCHTSNPAARDVQTLPVYGRPLYEHVARTATAWSDRVGLVVGATYPDAVARVRALAPDAWLLLPGVGAQGGDPVATLHAARRRAIVPVSRAIAAAKDPLNAARTLRDTLRNAQAAADTTPPPPAWRDLALALHRIGAIQFGEFTLASGKQSPIYIDLRLMASHPDVLARAAYCYAEHLRTLTYDRIAGIPYAGLPIGTAVALTVNAPFIYPRKEAKTYGRARAIEGAYNAGERVVVVEDLATTGGSALKGVHTLREAGLVVEDVVVLIDRESGARENLAAQGVRLHATMRLRDLLRVLHEAQALDAEMYAAVLRYLES